jgi:hypothetical protein
MSDDLDPVVKFQDQRRKSIAATLRVLTNLDIPEPVFVRHCANEAAFLLYWNTDGWTEAMEGHLGSYPISEDRCSTHEALVKWLVHLFDKSWFTKEHARQLIRVAGKRWSLDLRGV